MGVPAGDIFVVSDLHLGDGGLRDKLETGRKTPELRAFLDHVGAEGGELFIHGHETDPWNAGDDPGFGRMLAIFAGVFEDENGSALLASGEGVGDVLEQFGESMLAIWRTAAAAMTKDRRAAPAHEAPRPGTGLTPAQDPDRLVEHVAGVRADRAERGYDVAVLGHTHKAGRIGDWYFNSGTWVGPRSTFLRISPEGDVRYLEWKEGRAVAHAMPVILCEAKPRAAHPARKDPFGAAVSAARTLFPRPTKPDRSRWALIAQGALALALGAATLAISAGHGASAGWHLLVSAFGAYALLDGAMSLAAAWRAAPFPRLLSLARGVSSLLLGVVVLRRGHAVDVFVILVGLSAFVAGALRVAAALVLRRLVESPWLTLAGAGAMLAGLVLLLLPPSAPLLKIVLSGYLCYYGAGELLAGVLGRRAREGSFAGARLG